MSFQPSHKSRVRLIEIAVFCVAAVCMSGCGPAGVHGRVTYDGKPVAADWTNHVECEICFRPADDRRPACGNINADGFYRLSSFTKGDGAIPGKYTVTIKAVKVHPSSEGSHGGNDWLEWLVPKRYENQATSGLTAVVESDDTEINIDLPKE